MNTLEEAVKITAMLVPEIEAAMPGPKRGSEKRKRVIKIARKKLGSRFSEVLLDEGIRLALRALKLGTLEPVAPVIADVVEDAAKAVAKAVKKKKPKSKAKSKPKAKPKPRGKKQ